MAKINVILQGNDADMLRLYDHLTYHVKKIEDGFTEHFDTESHKKTIKFWVVI